MTLIVHDGLVQRSDEWYDARRGMITASQVGQLVTPKTVQVANNTDSRRLTFALAAERITGWSEQEFVSDDMWRGIDDEPRARDKYAEHYAPVTEAGFMVEDKWGFKIGYSPDGLVGTVGLIEVKSRRPKAHLETILADAPPAESMAQLQCALLVSGRDWIDYISYCGGMPMWRKHIEPEQKWFDAILDAAERTETAISAMVREYNVSVASLPQTERTLPQEMVI